MALFFLTVTCEHADLGKEPLPLYRKVFAGMSSLRLCCRHQNSGLEEHVLFWNCDFLSTGCWLNVMAVAAPSQYGDCHRWMGSLLIPGSDFVPDVVSRQKHQLCPGKSGVWYPPTATSCDG